MLNTVSKVGKVLDLFSFKQPEWGVSEVAKALHLPKSTASDIMTSLTEQRLLTRVQGGRYRLGWRLFELSQVLLENTEFCIEARLVMQELVERWGETTHLAVLDGAQVLYVEKLQATPAVQILLSRVGGRLPAHCSAVGKVLLSHQEQYRVPQLLEDLNLLAFTPNTITTLDKLTQELEEVQRRGYAYDYEEVALGLCCIAAPIRDLDGKVIAAISLSVPTQRFYPQQENYATIILKSAQRISENLGYRMNKSVHMNRAQKLIATIV